MRINLGGLVSVSATDRWYDEIRRGRAFRLGAFQVAVAGEYSMIQILNPAGSGVNCLIYDLSIGPQAQAGLVWRRYDAALATDVGAGVNLLVGGAAGACHVYKASGVAALGTAIAYFQQIALQSLQPLWPWVCELGPGKGCLANADGGNIRLDASFSWLELPV
jgi:hypothetical protein